MMAAALGGRGRARGLGAAGILALDAVFGARIKSSACKNCLTLGRARFGTAREPERPGHTSAGPAEPGERPGPGPPRLRNYLERNPNFANFAGKEAKADDGTGYGLAALVIAMFGISFACVPMYEYFCQKSGYLGTTRRTKTYAPPPEDPNLKKFEIDFVTHSHLNWEFKPSQKRVVVRPGETTLCFYTAKNLSTEPLIGVAAYHVIPDEAGQYFNKIQCFCFEEQLLNPGRPRTRPGEEVDLPVLFFLDKDILEDKKLRKPGSRADGVDKITLSYIFFQANSEIPPEYKTLFKYFAHTRSQA